MVFDGEIFYCVFDSCNFSSCVGVWNVMFNYIYWVVFVQYVDIMKVEGDGVDFEEDIVWCKFLYYGFS